MIKPNNKGPEIWADIKGYSGKYQVSDMGRVRSLKGKHPQVMSQYRENNGYMRVGISHKNKKGHISVHRAVAEAFIPNPEDKPQINHIDSNKENNRVENLEWCTVSENMKHSWDSGTRTSPCRPGEKHHNAKLTREDVIRIKKTLRDTSKLQSEIASEYSVDPSVISCINTGKYWGHVKPKEV